MGIALPGADAAAWRVDEDAVEFRLGRELRGSVPRGGAVIEKLRAGGAAFQHLQAAFAAIGGPDHALVRHEVGEMKQFSALAGAGVPPRLTRLRRASVADELRSEILDLEGATVKRGGQKQILRAGVTQRFASGGDGALLVWSLGFGVWSPRQGGVGWFG